MNSVNYLMLLLRMRKYSRVAIFLYTTIAFIIYLCPGCSDRVNLPSEEQIIEFENAGPRDLALDIERLMEAKIIGAPYRVLPNEVIELTMPAILNIINTQQDINNEASISYICRISEEGTITLPIIGEIKVAGMTLAQIESVVVDAYYPEYALTIPSVYATISEYVTAKVSISGAVQSPGVYELRTDQMSLVSLLMEAGGIVDEGASLIRIIHQNDMNVNNNAELSPQESGAKTNQTIAQKISTPTKAAFLSSHAESSTITEADLKMRFRQSSDKNSKGVITISYVNEIIVSEQVDITNQSERLYVINKLIQKMPGISGSSVEDKLRQLAEQIQTGLYRNEQKLFEQNRNIIRAGITQENTDSIYSSQTYTSNLKSKVNLQSNVFNATDYSNIIQADIANLSSVIQNQTDESSEVLILPVKGYNIPFSDINLKNGDIVIVERLELPMFSVIGLVMNPGNFQYPLSTKYNLIQALAFAGGLDPASEPRYVTVYRLKQDGEIVHAVFKVVNEENSYQLTDSLNVTIKPGDIISVEHTPRTRTNIFLNSVFRINMGTYYNLGDIWNN